MEGCEKQNSQITKAIVQDFIKRQAIRQTKKEPKWNSWVPREALQTIQIDLAEMPKRIFGPSEFKYALFAYDVFSKQASRSTTENKKLTSHSESFRTNF